MMIPRQEISPTKKGERSVSQELGRITALQREWNALSDTERASIAKESCDLASFFQKGSFAARRKLLAASSTRDLALARSRGPASSSSVRCIPASC